MEKLVKVWNDNIHPYEEKFKGNFIRIEPGKFIEMEYDEAKLFLGTFVPIVRGGDDRPDPVYFKRLRLDQDDVIEVRNFRAGLVDSDDKEKVYMCHACTKELRTKTGLERHIKDKHLDDIMDKEARDELHDREDI